MHPSFHILVRIQLAMRTSAEYDQQFTVVVSTSSAQSLRLLQTRENAMYQEGREAVTITEWTDRIYQNTAQEHIITNVVSGRKMRIQKYNFPDTGKSLRAEYKLPKICSRNTHQHCGPNFTDPTDLT